MTTHTEHASPLVAYGDALAREAHTAAARVNKRTCYRKFEYADLDSYKTLTSSGRANFDRFMKAIDMYMELTGFRMGYMQVRTCPCVFLAYARQMTF